MKNGNRDAYEKFLFMVGAEIPPLGQWTPEWDEYRKDVLRLTHAMFREAANRAVLAVEDGLSERLAGGMVKIMVRRAIMRPMHEDRKSSKPLRKIENGLVARRLMGRVKARCGLKRTVAAGPK